MQMLGCFQTNSFQPVIGLYFKAEYFFYNFCLRIFEDWVSDIQEWCLLIDTLQIFFLIVVCR